MIPALICAGFWKLRRSNLFAHHFLLGPPMSNCPCHAVRMKMNQTVRFSRSTLSPKPATIAFFGAARLVKKGNGRHELIGGTAGDCTAAREWCSLFAHEVVFTAVPEAQTPRKSTAFAV
jgi:hypothetical protein